MLRSDLASLFPRASPRRLHLETANCVFVRNLEWLRLTDPARFEHHFIAVAECPDHARDLAVFASIKQKTHVEAWNRMQHVSCDTLTTLHAFL